MEQENSNRNDSVFSSKIRAGRRRTYFFDVKTTRANDYYLTITESKKRFDGDGYERHKLFIYKEDFNKFIEELGNAVDHIKGLMPDFDFDAFNHKYEEQPGGREDYLAEHHDAEPAATTEAPVEDDQPVEPGNEEAETKEDPPPFSEEDLKL